MPARASPLSAVPRRLRRMPCSVGSSGRARAGHAFSGAECDADACPGVQHLFFDHARPVAASMMCAATVCAVDGPRRPCRTKSNSLPTIVRRQHRYWARFSATWRSLGRDVRYDESGSRHCRPRHGVLGCGRQPQLRLTSASILTMIRACATRAAKASVTSD